MKIIRDGERFKFTGDHQAFADWMLDIVDSSPDKLALFPMPHDDDYDGEPLEETVRHAYDLAKADRPDLGVKVMHAVDTGGPRDGESRILVVIHEHQWVGGQCVNGCPDTRKDG